MERFDAIPSRTFPDKFLVIILKRVRIMTDLTEQKIELSDAERQPCEVWTRVMGYFRPVSEFNIGKKSEYAERTCFKESKATECMLDVAAE